MRPTERIVPYINLLRTKIGELLPFVVGESITLTQKNLNELEEEWIENPDWRFTQLLVNTGIIPNYPGMWYHIEDQPLFINIFKFPVREVFVWGTYGKDADQPLKYKFLKEMSNNHIHAILDNIVNLVKAEGDIFNGELEFRKQNNFSISEK